MGMTRKVIAAFAAVTALFTFTACGSDDSSNFKSVEDAPAGELLKSSSSGDVTVYGYGVYVVQVEGRDLVCVFFDGYQAGGPSCNWGAYNASE